MRGVQIMFGLMLLAFASFAVVVAVETHRGERELAAMRPVTAVIDGAQVVRDDGERGRPARIFTVLVTYRYVIDGHTFTGNHPREASATQLAQLTPGASTTCYVDPRQPTVSTLNLRTTWRATGALAFAGVCLVMMWIVFEAPGRGALRRLVARMRRRPAPEPRVPRAVGRWRRRERRP